MTLVLSFVTNEYALQVSDTRVTFRDGSVADDNETKAVFWHRGISFAYSGEAELQRSLRVDAERQRGLGRQPTHMWIAEVLAGAEDLEAIMRRLCIDGDEAIDRTGDPRASKQHAFIGVGWTPVEGTGGVEPIIIDVSNSVPPHLFIATCYRTQSDGMYLHSSRKEAFGVPELVLLKPENTPEQNSRLMRRAVRRLADTDNTIGRNILETCIPRSEAESVIGVSQLHLVDGPPALNYSSFRYLRGATDAEVRTPTFVLGGNVVGQLNLGTRPVTLTFGDDSVTFSFD